jgi:hypothetical protein
MSGSGELGRQGVRMPPTGFPCPPRAVALQHHPTIRSNGTEVVKHLAEQWRALSPEERQVFEKESEMDRERYAKAMKDYQPAVGSEVLLPPHLHRLATL